MSSLKRRKLLHLFALAAGASVLPFTTRASSSVDEPFAALAQTGCAPTIGPFTAYMKQAEAALREEFKGITTDGQIMVVSQELHKSKRLPRIRRNQAANPKI